ncbi:MAG: hypothetical protein KIT72_11450 [Polyangiaceae bacterium]|nr:hypothetical protein [Polyangiaceae bacterium]MCW5791028.1 hypothetical protein [Polyangiaceae bacterium]
MTRRKGAVVAFSGVDCAGKSTQLQLLEGALSRRGHVVRVCWFRPGYGPELDALRRRLRRAKRGVLPQPGPSAERERAFQRPGVSELWLLVACLDALLQLAIKVRFWSLRGEVVICDRYLEDALIDLELRFPAQMARAHGVVRRVLRACPRPDAHFLLMLDEAAQRERMAAKQEPFPDAEPVRAARRARYDAWAEAARGGSAQVSVPNGVSCAPDRAAPPSRAPGAQAVVLDGAAAPGVIHARLWSWLTRAGVVDARA